MVLEAEILPHRSPEQPDRAMCRGSGHAGRFLFLAVWDAGGSWDRQKVKGTRGEGRGAGWAGQAACPDLLCLVGDRD